jgi:DNA repair photolyase
MIIREVLAKSIITKSKLPDTDFVVNPYTGCAFACMYCYACFMGRFVGEDKTAWGEYVYVKKNAVELFNKDLKKLQSKQVCGSIFLSSVTDPYQNCEHKYQLTRGILQSIAAADYNGVISILTKSPLVLRDVDIIKEIKNIEVGLTITSLNDKLSRRLEVHAPSTASRLKTLHELNKLGVKTYCFIGPLLPHFKNHPSELESLISGIANAGVKYVYVEHINLKKYISDSLVALNDDSDTRELYKNAKSEHHRAELGSIVTTLLNKYGLRLKMNQVIDHMKS